MAEDKKIQSVKYNGKEHQLVNPGARWYLKHMDGSKSNTGFMMQEKYVEGLLKNCLAPGLSIDDFGDDIKGLQEVSQAIEKFLNA